MKVKDILPDYSLKYIEVRTYNPVGEDMLFGWCHWTGTTLVSDDGDSYYLNEEISKYEFDEENRKLTCWVVSAWE